MMVLAPDDDTAQAQIRNPAPMRQTGAFHQSRKRCLFGRFPHLSPIHLPGNYNTIIQYIVVATHTRDGWMDR